MPQDVDKKPVRLSKVAPQLGVSTDDIIVFLKEKNVIPSDWKKIQCLNHKITPQDVELLSKEFEKEKRLSEEVRNKNIGYHKDSVELLKQEEEKKIAKEEKKTAKEEKIEKEEKKEIKEEEPKKEEAKIIGRKEKWESSTAVKGLNILGKKDLKKAKKEEIPKETAPPEETEKKEEEIPKEPASPKKREVEKKEKWESTTTVKGLNILGKKELKKIKKEEIPKETAPPEETEKKEEEIPKEPASPKEIEVEKKEKGKKYIFDTKKLPGLTVVGKVKKVEKVEKKQVEVKKPLFKKKTVEAEDSKYKRVRRRIKIKTPDENEKNYSDKSRKLREEKKKELDSQVNSSFRKTIGKMSGQKEDIKKISSIRRHRKDKKEAFKKEREEREQEILSEEMVLKTPEFISPKDLSALMNIDVKEIISKCMSLGIITTINQKLEKDVIELIAGEFDYKVIFQSIKNNLNFELEQPDDSESIKKRAPVITIMGHVDHGKTSLLDYIRKTKVVTTESGNITQHIGAYEVSTSCGEKIVFLDTPGHKDFTAMRTRGAKITDIVVVVIAASDKVRPQTEEAIKHAEIAEVPIVFAINKMDLPTANPETIKQQLASMNLLVSDWGGKYSCYEISAKTGKGIEDMLDSLIIEADALELKADYKKRGVGVIIETSLDKGKGYIANVLVQKGEIKVGDSMVSGKCMGKIKAIFNQSGKKVKKAGPSNAIQILGLNGVSQSGEMLYITENEQIAKEVATKTNQIIREHTFRTQRRITLNDISKHIAQGGVQQLNIILKCDVEGSVEALSGALMKFSTEKIQVNIVYKAVGPIHESDVLLAKATNSVMIGFQIRPSPNAKKLAEKENVEIRLYSIIYEATEDLENTIHGLAVPEKRIISVGTMEVKEVFKVRSSGSILGGYVTEGTVKRDSLVKVVRDGVVIYGKEKGGMIDSLKRFQNDVKEVQKGYECGIAIKNFKDVSIGDLIEFSEEKEMAKAPKKSVKE